MNTHGHTGSTIYFRCTDEGTKKTKAGNSKTFPQILTGKGNYHRQGEKRHPEIIRFSKVNCDAGYRARKEEQRNKTDNGTYEGIKYTSSQSLSGLTLTGHRGTIKLRRNIRCSARNIQQNGRNQTAGTGTDINSHDEGKCRHSRQFIGKRQDQHKSSVSIQAGHTAKYNTQKNTKSNHANVQPAHHLLKALCK